MTGGRFNCWERQIATLLEPRFDLVRAWPLLWRAAFNPQPRPDDTFGSALRSVNFEVQAAISEAFGVEIAEYCSSSATDMLAVAERELRCRHGVLLFADAFHCPWSPAYGRYHNSHFVILREIDHGGACLLVDDVYHNLRGKELTFTEFFAAAGSLFSLRFPERIATAPPPARQLLAQAVARSRVQLAGTAADVAVRLARCAGAYSYEQETVDHAENWWASPLFAKLLKLEYAHNNIAAALRQEEDPLAEAFTGLARNWENVRVLLLGGRDRRATARLSRSVAAMAQRIADAAGAVEQQLPVLEAEPPAATTIDIRQLFNRRLFGTESPPSDASRLSLSKDDWQDTFRYDGEVLRFDLRRDHDGADCVACSGQSIELPHGASEAYVLYTRHSRAISATVSAQSSSGVRTDRVLSPNTLTEIVSDPQSRVHWAELQAVGMPTLRMGYLYMLRVAFPEPGEWRLSLPDDLDTWVLGVTVSLRCPV